MTTELPTQVTYAALDTVDRVTRLTLQLFGVDDRGDDFRRLVPEIHCENDQFVAELLWELFDLEYLAQPDNEERLTKTVTNLVAMSWAYPFERGPGDTAFLH